MTTMEFPGPGLTAEQWTRISELATSLRAGQALWISGYFAGLEHGARAPSLSPSHGLELPKAGSDQTLLGAAKSVSILFGSETGNGLKCLAA